MIRLAAAAIVLSAAWATAGEPAPKEITPRPIRFPDIGPAPKPAPPPAPVDPAAPKAAHIPSDAIYAIDSDIELHVLCSPVALVKVTVDAGPGWIRAVFVGGSGKVEKRQFTGKFIYLIEAAAPGAGELIVWPKAGAATDTDIHRQAITTLTGPRPPPKKDDVAPAPKPAPPPSPKPKPDPEPASPDVAWVIVVEESAERTPAQGKLFSDAAFWNGLRAKGVQMKLYDRDQVPPEKHYLDYTPEGGVPFVLLLDKGGKVIESFKYPASNAAIAKRIAK